MSRKSDLEARLTKIHTAIDATLDRGVQSYSTEIQSLVSLGLDQLRQMERDTRNEITRLDRGSRFGKIGFAKAT